VRNFPSDHIGSGWYMIGWSDDFPVGGDPVPLSYFERDLVVYRGASGRLFVLDAYCRHMGAHLGHGGCVEGDQIRCPYHGWVWNGADGANTEIPYSSPDSMGNLRLGAWPVHEVDDIVLVYYSCDGAPPLYDPPERMIRFEGETWPVSAATTKIWRDQRISPQYMAENAADAAHFKYVHKAAEVANIGDFTADGGVFKAKLDLTFGGHAPTTWATPHGPVDGYILTENWGLGLGWSRLVGFDDVIYLLGITPTSPYTADMRSTTWIARKRGDGSDMSEKVRDLWVAQQNHQVDSDLVIWNTLSYVDHAPWARSERDPMRMLRTWTKQFYGVSS
jgi:phenylpropionate dioxygenase-like ring-hydroxylating dioxygenase large terminal subunit